MGNLSDDLSDFCETYSEDEPVENALDMIKISVTKCMADALRHWKQSGIDKDEFIEQIKHYADYMEALEIVFRTAVIAAERVIEES